MQLNLQYEHIKTDFIFNSVSYTWTGDPPRYFNIRYPQNYVGRNVYIPEGANYFRIWNANRFNGNVTFPNSINNLYAAFYNCYNFNSPVSFDDKIKWHSQVSDANWVIKDTSWMFANCFNFDSVVRFPTYNGERISEISSVNCYAMFANCYNMHGQIYNFPSYGENYADCFYNCHNLDQELYFGDYVYNLRASYYGQYIADFKAMFANCYKLKRIFMDIPLFPEGYAESRGININLDYYYSLGNIKHSNRYYMFANCRSLLNSPFTLWNIHHGSYTINEASHLYDEGGLYCNINISIDKTKSRFFNIETSPTGWYDPTDGFIHDRLYSLEIFKGMFYNCLNLSIDSPYLINKNDLDDWKVDLAYFPSESRRAIPDFKLNILDTPACLLDLSETFYGINNFRSWGSSLWFDTINGSVRFYGTFANIKNYYISNDYYFGTTEYSVKQYKGERFKNLSETLTEISKARYINLSSCFYNTIIKTAPSSISDLECSGMFSVFGGFPKIKFNISCYPLFPSSLGNRTYVDLSSMFDNATFSSVEPTRQNKDSNYNYYTYNYPETAGVHTKLIVGSTIDGSPSDMETQLTEINISSMFENFKVDLTKDLRNKKRYIVCYDGSYPYRGWHSEFASNYSVIVKTSGNFVSGTFNSDTISVNAENYAKNFKILIDNKLKYTTMPENPTLYFPITFEVPYFYNHSSPPFNSHYNNILDPSLWDDLIAISENIVIKTSIIIRTYIPYGSDWSSRVIEEPISYFKEHWNPIKSYTWSMFSNRGISSSGHDLYCNFCYTTGKANIYINFMHYGDGDIDI